MISPNSEDGVLEGHVEDKVDKVLTGGLMLG